MKQHIAVIFGGRSAEHEVSIITAHIPVIEALTATGRYEVWPVYIGKDGSWYCTQTMNDLAYFKRDGWEDGLAQEKKVMLSFDRGLEIVWPGLRPKRQRIDLVFPTMHGTYGEDGSLMGLLRMADVPFVGCDMAASAIAMDKVLTKQLIAAEGVPVVPYVWADATTWERDHAVFVKACQTLTWPLFVKPVHLGSSIGITKARNVQELEQGLEVGFHYDDKVLVEKGIEDLIEVTLPIMGNDQPVPALVERMLNKTEFLDFNDKYLSSNTSMKSNATPQSEIPAKLDDALTHKIIDLGIKTYRTIGCEGVARVDFLIEKNTQAVYVNEVNTLPGSLYHHNWRKAGMSSTDLVTKLIGYAEERFRTRKKTSTIFVSDILKIVGGPKARS